MLLQHFERFPSVVWRKLFSFAVLLGVGENLIRSGGDACALVAGGQNDAVCRWVQVRDAAPDLFPAVELLGPTANQFPPYQLYPFIKIDLGPLTVPPPLHTELVWIERGGDTEIIVG